MRGNPRSNGGVAGFSDRTKTTPIPVQRTSRKLSQRILTSLNAGKMVPIMAVPLLREDSVTSGTFRIGFEMSETVEMLMNAVNVRVMTYLVPKLAFERFDGLDSINKSYEGIPMTAGGEVIPWFEMGTAQLDQSPILTAMGVHTRAFDQINTDYLEAYNAIWNFRAKNRSPDIPLRTRLQADLAPAFWQHQTFAHIVPDFDQALIDGEVPLNIVGGSLPVKGLGILDPSQALNTTGVSAKVTGESAPVTLNPAWNASVTTPASAGQAAMIVKGNSTTGYPEIFAEMAENGITVSLSNIELARKTQAFAALRRQYNGHSDEYIIDLLMDGIEIPDASWKQPMLLSDETTVFGMSKRYASDGASLTEHVVSGATMLDVRWSVPRVNVGGIIMMVVEIAPEQLFERQRDPYIHCSSVSQLPQFLRDTLDPEKVEVVQNQYVDVDHDTPTGTFGYAPLNHMWAKSMPRVGGKFFRPDVDGAFDEDRQRIWAVETKNPVLSTDFYLCTTMNYKPFVITDSSIDHFECLVRGEVNIRGNTVFGGLLVEATNDYQEVLSEAPQDRIDKPVTADATAPETSGAKSV